MQNINQVFSTPADVLIVLQPTTDLRLLPHYSSTWVRYFPGNLTLYLLPQGTRHVVLVSAIVRDAYALPILT